MEFLEHLWGMFVTAYRVCYTVIHMHPKIAVTVDKCWQEGVSATRRTRIGRDEYKTEPVRGVWIKAHITFEHQCGEATEISNIYWDGKPSERLPCGRGSLRLENGSITTLGAEWYYTERQARKYKQKDRSLLGTIEIRSTRWNRKIRKCKASRYKPKNVD